MKKSLLFLALLIGAGQASAHGKDGVQLGCDVGTAWNVSPYRTAFLFTREGSSPREVGVGGGRLFVDGKEVTLGAADRERIAALELEMRALVPELHKVALEAVDIAYTALTEVARALSSTPEKTVAELERGRRQSLAEIERAPMAAFNSDAIEAIVEPIIGRFIPDIVGGAVRTALKAAFSGEAEREQMQSKMERMERELDVRVDKRAKALEPLAERMCARLRRMDKLDDAIEWRPAGGESLQLLRVDPERGHRTP